MANLILSKYLGVVPNSDLKKTVGIRGHKTLDRGERMEERDQALEIERFYLQYRDPHGFVMPHGQVEFAHLLRDSRCFLLSEPMRSDGSDSVGWEQIAAIAMLYDVYSDGQTYYEAGGMRSILGGYHVQSIMHYARIYYYVKEIGAVLDNQYITAFYRNNDNSSAQVSKIYDEKNPPKALLNHRLLQIRGSRNESEGVAWFTINLHKLLKLARMLDQRFSTHFDSTTASFVLSGTRSAGFLDRRERGLVDLSKFSGTAYDDIEIRFNLGAREYQGMSFGSLEEFTHAWATVP